MSKKIKTLQQAKDKEQFLRSEKNKQKRIEKNAKRMHSKTA